jgi:hypothetical protein
MDTTNDIGRPYDPPASPDTPLVAWLGREVILTDDVGDTHRLRLTNVHASGLVTLCELNMDMVAAVVPGEQIALPA